MLYIVLSAVIAFVVSAVIFFYIGIEYRKKIAESKVSSAEEQAKKILEDGKRDVFQRAFGNLSIQRAKLRDYGYDDEFPK